MSKWSSRLRRQPSAARRFVFTRLARLSSAVHVQNVRCAGMVYRALHLCIVCLCLAALRVVRMSPRHSHDLFAVLRFHRHPVVRHTQPCTVIQAIFGHKYVFVIAEIVLGKAMLQLHTVDLLTAHPRQSLQFFL